MLHLVIRAYHANGTHLDLTIDDEIMSEPALFNILANSTKQWVHLPNDVVKNFPRINELYHAFVDPEQDIVGLILYQDMTTIGKLIRSRLFFDTREGRKVVCDNPDNMWLEKPDNIHIIEQFHQGEMSSDWHMGYYEDRIEEVSKIVAEHVDEVFNIFGEAESHCIKGDCEENERYVYYAPKIPDDMWESHHCLITDGEDKENPKRQTIKGNWE